MSADLEPDQKTASAHISYYFVDEQALNTLGVKLIAGRNFTASEILDRDGSTAPPATAIIITRTLAQRLFLRGDALGKSLYTETKASSPHCRHHRSTAGTVRCCDRVYEHLLRRIPCWRCSVLWGIPRFMLSRTKPGSLNDVMKAAQSKLEGINGTRIINATSMHEVRAKAYRSNRGLTLILGAVAFILVAVTAFGMAGLTSYWVAERHRQIGIRRALGATRLAILRLFQKENFAISLSGVLAGILLAVAPNIWLIGRFEMVRLNPAYVIAWGIAMLLLGQITVLWPAMRASQVPPALAIRGTQSG